MTEISYLKEAELKNPRKRYGLHSAPGLQRSASTIRGTIKTLGKMSGAEDAVELATQVFNTIMPKPASLPALENQPVESTSVDIVPVDPTHAEAEKGRSEGYRRKYGDSPLLSDLITVVQYALSLPPNIPKQKAARQQFPSILKSNVLAKWIRKYFSFRLWKMDMAIASTLRSIPNWWLDDQNLPHPRRARDTIAGMPREVAQLCDQAETTCIIGQTAATKRADAGQSSRRLKQTMVAAMEKFNEQNGQLRDEIVAQNQSAWSEFREKFQKIADTDEHQKCGSQKKRLGTMVRNLRAKVKKLPRDFSKWKPTNTTVVRFHRRFAKNTRATNTQGNFLAIDDPRMVHIRSRVRSFVEEHQIHWGMVLNLGF